jgi:hypothetical protein
VIAASYCINHEKMTRHSIAILLLTGLLFSCHKNEPDQTNNPGLVIKAGFECGWGSGTDSIYISRAGIKYAYYIPARSQQPQINETRSISAGEWTEIESDADLKGFIRLQYQSCNICFDGCDEWIFIRNGDISHKITFGKGRKIDSISSLQTKLAEIRAEFNVH